MFTWFNKRKPLIHTTVFQLTDHTAYYLDSPFFLKSEVIAHLTTELKNQFIKSGDKNVTLFEVSTVLDKKITAELFKYLNNAYTGETSPNLVPLTFHIDAYRSYTIYHTSNVDIDINKALEEVLNSEVIDGIPLHNTLSDLNELVNKTLTSFSFTNQFINK